MNWIRKYKTIVSAILLVLYGFIATPVQLWHQHNYNVLSELEKPSEKKEESNLFKCVKQSAEANCKICSHHYSVYNNVTNILFELPTPIYITEKDWYNYSIPSSLILSFSNKGPPAIA